MLEGIECTFVNACKPEEWAAALKPNTRAFYVEAIANPLTEVADLDAVVAFSKAKGLVSLIDGTLATPVNFRPLDRGFDLVVHSDIVAGAVAGSSALIEKVKHKLDHLGGTLDPHACFLLHRGLKTLALRVCYQNESALTLAQWLEANPAVARMIERLKLPVSAPSLGGPETLITLPALTSHAGLSAEARRAQGISDALIRLSVGLEATEDLIEDFQQALDERAV